MITTEKFLKLLASGENEVKKSVTEMNEDEAKELLIYVINEWNKGRREK